MPPTAGWNLQAHRPTRNRLRCRRRVRAIRTTSHGGATSARVLPAVLAPDAASAVSHELVGHLLEADNWETARGFLGDRRNLGPSCLNVTERASAEHGWGAFQRDDEGMPTLSTPLVRNGEIVDQLVNKHHAAVRGSDLTDTESGRRTRSCDSAIRSAGDRTIDNPFFGTDRRHDGWDLHSLDI